MQRMKNLKNMRLHCEGYHTIIAVVLILALFGALLYRFDAPVLVQLIYGIGALVFLGLIINFFRCPIRTFTGDRNGAIVSPVDGKVVVIEEVNEQEYFHDKRLMISIFMDVTNVHAQWFPCDGTVIHSSHTKGLFYKAYLPKASTDNERSMVVIRTENGLDVMARQIAGAVARRIVTYCHPGDKADINDQLGFIKFGSRVDLYLPIGTEPTVVLGQKTVGCETVVAKLP
ncbi:MAG TPA: phosphatidylserine decarboxylase family protein [Bacteroidaceae bacterium]|nr:phosphatidylserine decarboxylase family protein [Bacteroidaceae bacterium]